MKILILAVLAMAVQLFLFLCAGSVVLKAERRSEWSLSGSMLLGFFVYFSVFEVICFICEVTLSPLSRLSVIMLAVSTAMILAGTVYCRKDWAGRLKTLPRRVREHGPLLAAAVLLTAAVCVFVFLYTDASADSDYYVGMTSTALFTNSIGRFDPTSGMLLKAINPRYAYALYPFHNAVVADLFHIPAVVSARTVMSVINALLSCIAFYRLGLSLFPASDGAGTGQVRRAEVFTVLLLVLNLFSSTIYLPGTFLFSRTFEGKHIIANIVLPAVLSACAGIYRNTAAEEKGFFMNLFFVMLAGICFSASVAVPAMVLIGAAGPYFLVKRRGRDLAGLLFALLPFFLWAALYVLNSRRVFVLLTYR